VEQGRPKHSNGGECEQWHRPVVEKGALLRRSSRISSAMLVFDRRTSFVFIADIENSRHLFDHLVGAAE